MDRKAILYFQSAKTIYILLASPFYTLLLYNVPRAGPWNPAVYMNITVIGPYSAQWYGFYNLFSLAGYLPEIALFCLLDTVLMLVIGSVESSRFTFLAMTGGFFFLFYDPGDLLIYWLALLSRGHWFLSVTAILTKLPIGAPLSVWQYLWNISIPQDSHPVLNVNSLRFLVLGLAIGQPLITRFKRKILA